MATTSIARPIGPNNGVFGAISAFQTIAREAQNAAAALAGIGTTPPILINTDPMPTRGLSIDPGDFSSTPSNGAAPTTLAVSAPSTAPAFSANELAVLGNITALLKAEIPQLSSANAATAAQARTNVSLLSCYIAGLLEARGFIPFGSLASKLAPDQVDPTAQAQQLAQYLDLLVQNPGETRIIPILVGVIIGMAVSAYIYSH